MMNAVRDMINQPSAIRYFLIDPFQLKCLFYPLFLALLLQLFSWRIDIFYTVPIVGLFILLNKAKKHVIRICTKIDTKVVTESMVDKGFRLTDTTEADS